MGVNNFNIIFLVIFLSLTSGLLHNTKFNNFSTLPIHISKGISHNISFTMVENTKFYSNSPNILHNNDMDMVHKSFKSSLFNNLEKKSLSYIHKFLLNNHTLLFPFFISHFKYQPNMIKENEEVISHKTFMILDIMEGKDDKSFHKITYPTEYLNKSTLPFPYIKIIILFWLIL